jgi:hypothetical protein
MKKAWKWKKSSPLPMGVTQRAPRPNFSIQRANQAKVCPLRDSWGNGEVIMLFSHFQSPL